MIEAASMAAPNRLMYAMRTHSVSSMFGGNDGGSCGGGGGGVGIGL